MSREEQVTIDLLLHEDDALYFSLSVARNVDSNWQNGHLVGEDSAFFIMLIVHQTQ